MKRRAAVFLFCIAVCLTLPGLLAAQPPEYPRTVESDELSMQVHHPLIDRWVDYALLEGWIPVEVTRGEGRSWVGAVRAQARTSVNLDQRLVQLRDKRVVDLRFSGPQPPDAVRNWIAESVLGSRHEIMLDELLLSLAEDFEPPVPVRDGRGFNQRPPRIVVSEAPMTLLLIDEEPVRAPIEGTSLDVVVNTDRDLFFDRDAAQWYLINEGTWQTQALLASGDWTSTERLPADVQQLAAGDRWASVREALPPRLPAERPPAVLVSLEPTELVVIAGEPRLQAIPGADGLAVVSNTTRDLFRFEGAWYFLAAGRWFEAEALDGEWALVESLPEVFQDIPPDHGRASVRRSVPGTLESALAYIEATLPQERVLALDSAPAAPVWYAGEPRFEPIEETELARAVNSPFAVIRHNNFYYLNHEAAWYRSVDPSGPWRVAVQVPDALFDIPPSDPLYPVTFVRPVGNSDGAEEARFQYTEGYNGRYTIGRRAVEGTGWRYRPWISYPAAGPVYWGYPPTYGWRHPAYWGGPWMGMAYPTVQQVEIDGPLRGVGGMPANVSEQDPGVTRRGYDYTTLAQQRGAGDTLSPYLADDLFADPRGQVYRRSEEGWSRHENGEWSTMADLQRQYGVSSPQPQAPQERQRQAYRQNEDDIERMERYYDRRAKSYNMYSTIAVRP